MRTPIDRATWLKRLGWFGLLYVVSAASVIGVAYGLKALIPH